MIIAKGYFEYEERNAILIISKYEYEEQKVISNERKVIANKQKVEMNEQIVK